MESLNIPNIQYIEWDFDNKKYIGIVQQNWHNFCKKVKESPLSAQINKEYYKKIQYFIDDINRVIKKNNLDNVDNQKKLANYYRAIRNIMMEIEEILKTGKMK